MPTNYSQFGPLLFAVVVLLIVYRRLRRTFGKQLLKPTRMMFRIGLLFVVGLSAGPAAIKSAAFLSAAIAGLIAGIGLAIFGAERTRFVMYRERLCYVPHTYTGIAVSMLFLGRLAYRFSQAYVAAHAAPAHAAVAAEPTPGFSLESMVRSPLTVGLLYVLIGYYVCYYSSVLYKSKHIKRQDIETLPAAAAQ